MYKELLEKSGDYFYLDYLPLEVNEELIPYYFEIIIAKLDNENINYLRIKKELTKNHTKSCVEKILVLEKDFAQIKKELYLFTKIACTTNNINQIDVVDFANINLALDCSVNLCHRFNEYHLIKKNKYAKYSIYHTFDKYDITNLEQDYEKKYIKSR